jgi:RND family efflux transporter MFP subunit
VSELKGDLDTLRLDRERSRAPGGRRFVIPALATLVLVAAAAAWLLTRGPGPVEIETARPVVQSAPSPGGPGAALLTASGYVVPRRKAVVSAKIQGRLSELRVEEGSRVQEGDIIARLESTDFVAEVASARAAVQRADADLEENRRQLRLARQLEGESVVSRDAREAAESRVRISEAALAQAKAQLDVAEARFRNTLIRAPFTGVVLRKMAEVGESVAPIPPGVNLSTSSGAIVALADLDTLEVEADVSESNVARLSSEQPAEVGVEAFPDRRYKAVLRQIIPTADRTRATVMVKVTILDKDPGIKPEMNARVTFLEAPAAAASAADATGGGATGGAVAAAAPPPPPAIIVPAGAVIDRDGRTVVFEVVDDRARVRGVVVGGSRDGRTVVRQGLTGNETLVLNPSATLRDGDRVRVRG